jgi:hypothetical protein
VHSRFDPASPLLECGVSSARISSVSEQCLSGILKVRSSRILPDQHARKANP